MFSVEKEAKGQKKLFLLVICVILIYLGIQNIGSVAEVFVSVLRVIAPILIGGFLAMVFNVPMCFIEDRLVSRTRLNRGIRPLAIALSMVLVFGIMVAVFVLVLPELFNALKVLFGVLDDFVDHIAHLSSESIVAKTRLGSFLMTLDMDWSEILEKAESYVRSASGALAVRAVNTAGSIAGLVANIGIGLVFSVYMLANKERLMHQAERFVHIWLPSSIGEKMIHITSVFSRTFRNFIGGQATEAIILGTLCMIGMLVLRIPYAPMVGALVGVTALIPIVGAFVGTLIGVIMILSVAPFKAVIFVIFFLILQQIEGNLIYPRVVGTRIRLPAMWVLAAVTIGGKLAGPLGMLLGVPTFSAIYALTKEATEKREKKLAQEKI